MYEGLPGNPSGNIKDLSRFIILSKIILMELSFCEVSESSLIVLIILSNSSQAEAKAFASIIISSKEDRYQSELEGVGKLYTELTKVSMLLFQDIPFFH